MCALMHNTHENVVTADITTQGCIQYCMYADIHTTQSCMYTVLHTTEYFMYAVLHSTQYFMYTVLHSTQYCKYTVLYVHKQAIHLHLFNLV